jgi:hypothetical protein
MAGLRRGKGSFDSRLMDLPGLSWLISFSVFPKTEQWNGGKME